MKMTKRNQACVCVCVSSHEACCLAARCARLRASRIIKYPFDDDYTFDATVSIATGSTELHNSPHSLQYLGLCYVCRRGNRSDNP